MTALQKPAGGVRGIAVGRLAGRTLAKQFAEHTECVAHVVQAFTSLDPSATILSIDSVGAFDSISRRSMFRGLSKLAEVEIGRNRTNGVALFLLSLILFFHLLCLLLALLLPFLVLTHLTLHFLFSFCFCFLSPKT